MAIIEKEQPEKIFCLFHQKIDCPCIHPVLTEAKLKERLNHHINLNDILNKHAPDGEDKTKREQQTADHRRRLDELEIV